MHQILKHMTLSKTILRSNSYTYLIALVENNLYKMYDNKTLNNINNVSKHINQYATVVVQF